MTSKKAKSKGKSVKAKSKANPKRPTKPLLAESVFVRSATPTAPRGPQSKTAERPTLSQAAPINPAPTKVGSGLMAAWSELPVRLARCRTPMDVWLVQMRFAQSVFGFPVPRD
jgi:hypothetical protein